MKSHSANPRLPKAVTLLELLIAMVLIGMIVLGLHTIEIFSRFHILASDRRVKLQNDATYVLEHLAKTMLNAVGDVGDASRNPIETNTIEGDNALRIWTDTNSNGQRDTGDKQVAYRYNATNYEIWYYSNYTDAPDTYEVITKGIIRPDFNTNIDATQPTYFVYSSANNYIEAQITACWDPDEDPNACATADNPSITMKACINMPSVSTIYR
jgi:prepilin-type N-terminal cleavage/methylation domain-containing protein